MCPEMELLLKRQYCEWCVHGHERECVWMGWGVSSSGSSIA